MYANNKMILQLISLLKQFGIRKVVVSPGCRHIPFVHSLEYDNDFELYTVVDERSAAFFALGLIQQSGEPVAVTCTSGTACQNYGSAVVEAYYQHLPLLVLSGDRLDALLNQNEDQMYDQVNSFRHCTKYQTKLPYIQSELDEWHCNRLINEALIELTALGRGPVHISFPIVDHFKVSYDAELPTARKIDWHAHELSDEAWTMIAERLKGKKVAIVWGQSVVQDDKLKLAVEDFCQTFDAIILTDKITNCHYRNTIQNTWVLLSYMNNEDKLQLAPDLIIKVGGTNFFNMDMKQFAMQIGCTHWQVGEFAHVCDEFHSLSDVFEMSEEQFFRRISECAEFENVGNYAESWMALSKMPQERIGEYNEMCAIGTLLQRLPKDCDLQLANSLTIRFANFFDVDSSISVNCNRALSGIDGSMSTAIGYAAASNRPMFYITGDLSFFYDMNSLSIKHLSKKMRILLINNNGGGCLWHGDDSRTEGQLPIYCASQGHPVEAKRWVESVGFKYLSAHNQEELDKGISELIDVNGDQPILLEVFTEMTSDYDSMGEYIWSEASKRAIPKLQLSFQKRLKRKIEKGVKKMISREKIEAIKVLLK